MASHYYIWQTIYANVCPIVVAASNAAAPKI